MAQSDARERSRSPHRAGDDDGTVGPHQVSYEELVEIGLSKGLAREQAVELAQKIKRQEIKSLSDVAGATLSTSPAMPPALPQMMPPVLPPTVPATMPPAMPQPFGLGCVPPVPVPLAPPLPSLPKQEEAAKQVEPNEVSQDASAPIETVADAIDRFLDTVDEAKEKLKIHMQEFLVPSGSQRRKPRLEVTLDVARKLIRKAEESLSELMPVEPLEHVHEMPSSLKVAGFLSNPTLNQEYHVDPESNLNEMPVYWSQDKNFFMYREAKHGGWLIGPAESKDAARWGDPTSVASEKPEVPGEWLELDPRGVWECRLIQCQAFMPDLRQPVTPP